MTTSFCAYIDESGDEGFTFLRDAYGTGCSDWFILAAFVTRKKTDLETVKIIDEVRSTFGIPEKKHLHWCRLKHPQKIKYAQMLLGKQARILAVCVHKPSLKEPEKFQERYRLYFYAVRYLLERLSWFSRDHHNPANWGGNGSVEIIFSNRQGMSYAEMKDYLCLLRAQKEAGKDIRIDFEKVRIDSITTLPPGKSMGLQLADAAAGAVFNGLEPDRYGNTEPRYILTLSPLLYKHKTIAKGYGIKIVPREATALVEREAAWQWLKEIK